MDLKITPFCARLQYIIDSINFTQTLTLVLLTFFQSSKGTPFKDPIMKSALQCFISIDITENNYDHMIEQSTMKILRIHKSTVPLPSCHICMK